MEKVRNLNELKKDQYLLHKKKDYKYFRILKVVNNKHGYITVVEVWNNFTYHVRRNKIHDVAVYNTRDGWSLNLIEECMIPAILI